MSTFFNSLFDFSIPICASRNIFSITPCFNLGLTKISGKFDSLTANATGAANPAGGVDVKFTETLGAGEFTQDMAGGEGEQPIHVNAKIGSGTFDGAINGAKSAAFLQLFKFIAAHAEKTLAAFGVALQSEVDLEQVCRLMLRVVEDTVQPSRATLWLRQPDRPAEQENPT